MKTNRYWFAPKVYGYGIVPISWEGWGVLLVMILVIVVLVPLVLGKEDAVAWWRLVLFFVLVTSVGLSPLFLLKSKMKGTMKWRWGVKDIDWS